MNFEVALRFVVVWDVAFVALMCGRLLSRER